MTVTTRSALTDEIKRSVERVWELLLKAHERQVWRALGYESWSAYISAEFEFSRVRAYQLVDQARVIRELETAAGVNKCLHVTEGQARALKPVIDQVTDEIRKSVRGVPASEVRQIVADVVAHEATA